MLSILKGFVCTDLVIQIICIGSNPKKSQLPAGFESDSGSVGLRERRDSNFGLKEFRRASSLLLAENEKQSRKASTVSRKASTVSRPARFYTLYYKLYINMSSHIPK